MVPSGADEAVTIVRDFTEQRRAEAGKRRLAAEQAALRRVATLVAGNAPPGAGVPERDGGGMVSCSACGPPCWCGSRAPTTATFVGKYGGLPGRYVLGYVAPLDAGSDPLRCSEPSAPIRVDYADLANETLQRFLELGFRGEVGVPITVAGATWGALVVVLPEDETMPAATEHRLHAFAELVGLAVASADARNEVSASRRRIVEASDTERKRLERNLHDGAQQRLVAFALGLRVAQSKLRKSPDEADAHARQLAEELVGCDRRAARARAGHPSGRPDRARPRGRRSRCSPPGRRCRWSSTSTSQSASRSRSRRPRTTPSRRRSRTSPSMRGRARRG